MRIVLLGPPGAGKGTQAKLLAKEFNLLHISTGDLLREEMKKNSDLGKEVKKFVESGGLVPDEIVTQMIKNKLTVQSDSRSEGYILDGFPRTEQQAESLDQILDDIQQPIDATIFMEATLPVVTQRLTGRRVCRDCGALFHVGNKPPKKDGVCDQCQGELYQRPDDNEETIKKRMDVYMKNTQSVISHYQRQNKLVKVNGDRNAEKVRKQIIDLFHETERQH